VAGLEGRHVPVIEAFRNEKTIAEAPKPPRIAEKDLLFSSAILGVFGALAIGPSMEFAGFTG